LIRIAEGIEGAELAARMGEKSLAIVVDALRSSATLAAMLCAGASEIYVCSDVETSRATAARFGGSLLAGERDSRTPEGFEMGNSPLEAAEKDLQGKRVVFTSSNGAPILVACRGAGDILMGGAVNAQLVTSAAQQALTAGCEVVIIPARDHGRESVEDTASAVLLADVIGPDIDPSQEAMLSRWRARIIEGGLETLFRESGHGKELSGLGFGDDLRAAATPDLYPALPKVLEFINIGASTVARVGNGA
jgi:2-phosphosulfolactate phosphatase